MSDTESPAFSIAFRLDGTGPYAMMLGSSPTTPQETILERGSSPSASALDADLTTTAAAPSTTPDAFPAVTKDCGPK